MITDPAVPGAPAPVPMSATLTPTQALALVRGAAWRDGDGSPHLWSNIGGGEPTKVSLATAELTIRAAAGHAWCPDLAPYTLAAFGRSGTLTLFAVPAGRGRLPK